MKDLPNNPDAQNGRPLSNCEQDTAARSYCDEAEYVATPMTGTLEGIEPNSRSCLEYVREIRHHRKDGARDRERGPSPPTLIDEEGKEEAYTEYPQDVDVATD
jgi:hypothetical protein